MVKLMKYEFRKTMFSKILLLVITAILELVYLAGVFLEKDTPMMVGVMGLVFCAVFGIMYIGIESINVFHKDLNTKQSYMLFLTPNSSFKILGAKVLENGISLVISGVFYVILAAIDISVAILYIGGLKDFLDFAEQLAISFQVNVNITPSSVIILFFTMLASWLMTIVTADLAVVLSATVFAGKKFSGLVSFVLFIGLTFVTGKLLEVMPSMDNLYIELAVTIGVILVVVALMYVLTAWIMDKKLSV